MANKENPVNRKKIVGLAREKLLSRGLTIATGIILALVIGLVGWGLVQEKIINPRTIVAVIEGKEINGDDFVSRVRINRQQLITNYMQNLEEYQLFTGNPELQQQVISRMSQIQSRLAPAQVGLTTINQMVDDELIILEAQKLGIRVSDEDVEKELQSFFSYFPEGTPTIGITPTFAANSTLSDLQFAIVSVTPTATAFPTNDSASTIPTSSMTPTSDPNVEAASTATPQATPTPFTEEAFNAVFTEYLNIQFRELGLNEESLRQLVKINLYRDQLFLFLTADIVTKEEQVWARHILLEEEQSAIDLLDQLDDGAEWSELALEHSTDLSNAERGGDLEWFTFDAMVQPFAESAFELSIGEISDPIESQFGWHIIQVLGHENRPLSIQALAVSRNELFQNFILGLRSQYEWEIITDKWFSITPDEPDIPAQYRLSQ